MNESTLFGDRRMTVKEVADALGTAESTIRNKVGEMFPEIVRNGIATYLDEGQVTAIKQAIIPHDLTLKSKLDASTTDLEMLKKTAEVMAWSMAKIEAQKAELAAMTEQLAIAAPKAEITDRIAGAEGLKTLAEVGKINGIGPRKIIDLLLERGILYRKGKALLPNQKHVDAGRFVARERTFTINETEHLYTQVYVTGKGEVWLARQMFAIPGPQGQSLQGARA